MNFGCFGFFYNTLEKKAIVFPSPNRRSLNKLSLRRGKLNYSRPGSVYGSDIPAGDGKIGNLFLQCSNPSHPQSIFVTALSQNVSISMMYCTSTCITVGRYLTKGSVFLLCKFSSLNPVYQRYLWPNLPKNMISALLYYSARQIWNCSVTMPGNWANPIFMPSYLPFSFKPSFKASIPSPHMLCCLLKRHGNETLIFSVFYVRSILHYHKNYGSFFRNLILN
jgi:hypothetical protein